MPVTIWLEPDEEAVLAALAERDGVSPSDVISEALRSYMAKRSRRESLDSVLDSELPKFSQALRQLGE